MRKVLAVLLSVGGLLGAVPAFSSPATAVKDVVVFRTSTNAAGNSIAGVYTVSWKTRGGCDPGAGTAGPAGEITLTVAPTGTDANLGWPTGEQVSTGVGIDDVCKYDFTLALVRSDGIACRPTILSAQSTFTLRVIGINFCETIADLTVVVGPYRKGTERPSNLDRDAVRAATFTVTATPTKSTAARAVDPTTEVGKGCKTVSGTTKITRVGSASRNQVALKVVGVPHTDPANTSATPSTCHYRVTVALPDGFAPGGGSRDTEAEAMATASPACSGAPASRSCTAVTSTLEVSVAVRKLILLQTVVGDADGAHAVYRLSTVCGGFRPPPVLPLNDGSLGVARINERTTVELRTGRFNVTAALAADIAAAGAGQGVPIPARDDQAEGCESTVTISGLPDYCTADSTSKSATLASASLQEIIEFTITCAAPSAEPPPPPAEPPPPPPPAEPPPPAGESNGQGAADGATDNGEPNGATDGDAGGDSNGTTGPQAMGDTG